MKLGSIVIPTDLLLAPLMDVTTPSFRHLILSLGGVGMIVTPMVFIQQIIQAPKTILPHLEHIEHQRPASVQIVSSGRNDDVLRKALDILNSFKFDVLDINGGCPAPHTMQSGGGGALLRDYDQNQSLNRLLQILRATLKYSHCPVSVKTRLGFSRDHDIINFGPLIEAEGASFLTVHGRTVRQKYTGSVNLERIKQVKDLLNIPVIGNGDVHDFFSYNQMKITTNCDAVMIGRAVMVEPRIFAQIWAQQQNSTQDLHFETESLQNRIAQIQRYLTDVEQFIERSSKYWNNEKFKVTEIRRLAIWFIKGIPGYRSVREKLSKINSFPILSEFIFGPRFLESFLIADTSQTPQQTDDEKYCELPFHK